MKAWVWVATAVVAWVALAPPAAAHPFGPPPTARVSAQDRAVTISWSATPDDAVAIGELLGLMPEGSVQAYRQEAAAQVAPSSRDEAALSASPLLRRYLTDNIVVEQAGKPCPAEVAPPPDFVHSGATLVATCPEPVEDVTLRITMLHDINEAYRTVAIGTGSRPEQAVFTVAAPTAEWRFGAATGSSSAPLPLAGVALVIVAAGAAAAFWAQRRREGRG